MLKLFVRNNKNLNKFFRNLSVAQPQEDSDRTKSWQVHSYGEELLCCPIRTPFISQSTDVLIKIEASSVNPIDIAMKDGYGEQLLKVIKCQDLVLPTTLGRDFAGTIIDKGHFVARDFNIGDKVYGIIPFHKDGAHAEHAIADETHICHMPEDILTYTEAASIPYTALTAWSALWITGALMFRNIKKLKVLILGASGGVGTCAVQMLKASGACVIGTCSSDAVQLVQNLGADCVLDYRDPDYFKNVASQGSYNIILDCANFGYRSIPSTWQYTSYITLNSPLLRDTDKYGLIGGLISSASDLIPANLSSLRQGKLIQWAYVLPCQQGIKFYDELVRNCKLKPVVEKVYPFNSAPEAYNKLKSGHARGKIVIDMLNVD